MRPDQRQTNALALLALGAVLAGCSAIQTPQDLYDQASRATRRGDLPAARVLVKQGLEKRATMDDAEWRWKFTLVQAQIAYRQGHADQVLAQISAPISDPRLRSLEVRRLTLLATAYAKLSRSEEAFTTLEQAEKLANESERAEIDLIYGGMLDDQRRPDLAERRYRDAVQSSVQFNNRYVLGEAYNDLGYLRMHADRYDDAESYYALAVTAFEASGAEAEANATRDNLAICYAKLGDFDRALEMRNKSLEYFKSRPDLLPDREENLGELGNVYMAQNLSKSAIPYFEEALRLAREAHEVTDAEIWAGNLAGALLNTHDWDRAAKMNDDARALASSAKRPDAIPYLDLNEAAIAAGRGDGKRARVLFGKLIASEQKKPDLLWETYAAAGDLEASSGHAAAARAYFEKAFAVIGKARSAIDQTQDKITFHARLIHFYQQYVDVLMDAGDARRALQAADSSRALVLSEGSVSRTPTTPAPAIDYQRVAARTGTVLLFYWMAPVRSRLWVVTARDTHSVELPPQEEIARHAEGYQRFIEERLGDPLVSRSADAQWLAEKVLQPADALIPAGSRVVIVPDGALHSVNLGTLPVGGPPEYWIKKVTLLVAPSLRIFASGATHQRAKTGSLLLIGDPSHPPDKFPRLSYAAKELAGVEARFPLSERSVLTQDNASPDGYRDAKPAHFSVIHFTAHAVANQTSPLDSAVILAPSNNEYKLFARDIVKIPLQADLVTLSACRSAGARAYAGEGLVGFTWAFLQAGARKVVAGLWDVNDRSTPELMSAMYEGLAKGLTPEEALRRAQIAMSASSGNLRKPYYWGAFQVYTGGS